MRPTIIFGSGVIRGPYMSLGLFVLRLQQTLKPEPVFIE
jgi:hypothetical protein